MTDLIRDPSLETGSFEERVEIIAKDLELAIRWQRPCILFAMYSSEYVRADVESLLENHLIDLEQQVVHVRTDTEHPYELLKSMEGQSSENNLVFFVDELTQNHAGDYSIYLQLNKHRELFNEGCIRIVFWLTQKEIVDLAHQAPEFWTYRHGVVEFGDSPKADQILAQSLEDAWQGTGEYADLFEDTDEKILLREAFLTDLPNQEETSSIRANLLLTLGILNWRKGDFEKASEQLQEALRIAARIQDNWFEAECFNATALLKSGMGNNEEAIEAYKQAIHLAPEQIFAWNNLGNLCTKIGRNDEALVAFQKAAECNPKDPIAWNGLGNVYQKIGYLDDAITAYRKSIQFMPSFAQPWNGLGDTYVSVGRVDDAINAYQQATQLNKHYILPWLRLGALYSKQDRSRDALRAYQHASTLDPKNSMIWNEIGLVYSKHHAYKDAEQAFSKVIEIDKGHGWAYRNLAEVYIEQGKYADSMPLLTRSIDLLKDDSEKAISWNRLGDVHRQRNEYDKAILAYETADRLEGMTPSIEELNLKVAGNSAVQTSEMSSVVQPTEKPSQDAGILEPEITPMGGGMDNADENMSPATSEHMDANTPNWITQSNTVAADYSLSDQCSTLQKAAIPAEPDASIKPVAPAVVSTKPTIDRHSNAIEWNEKGNSSFEQGAYEDAINAYNKAIQSDTELGWPYSNLAHIYLRQNQYPEAILLYQRGIELLDADKDKAICWNGLGNVYRCMNDYDNALAAYKKASELDPDTAGMRDGTGISQNESTPKSARAWNELGEAFFKSGSHKEAVTAFKKAIEMDDHFGWAYSNLAHVLSFQGKHAEAIPLYKTSLEMLKDDKDKAISLNRLGNAYRKLNDYDKAIESFRGAIALNSEDMNLVTKARFSLLSNCFAD
jgi:tetratricopeptide (TPR) repeat protein